MHLPKTDIARLLKQNDGKYTFGLMLCYQMTWFNLDTGFKSVRSALTLDASKKVVHAFVTSRVDSCNSVFSLARAKHLRPLQSVLNAAARVILRRQKYDHITDVVRDQLHWLPVTERIEYKLCSLVCKCLHQSVFEWNVQLRLWSAGAQASAFCSPQCPSRVENSNINVRSAQFRGVRTEDLEPAAVDSERPLAVRRTI